jgi:DNA modification methylase
MSTPYFRDDAVTLYTGDAIEVLAGLPEASVHCVVTSPPCWSPYNDGTARWSDRDPKRRHFAVASSRPRSGHDHVGCRRCGAVLEDRQYGREPTPQDYVDQVRAVFDELRRVLVDTGTVWLNLGDLYTAASPSCTTATAMQGSVCGERVKPAHAVPCKNLVGMPWRVVFALQRDGWLLRNAIVWHRPKTTSKSVRDRLPTQYELLFLLTKQQKYYFDLDAIREPGARRRVFAESIVVGDAKGRQVGVNCGTVYGKFNDLGPPTRPSGAAVRPTETQNRACHPRGKNPGDVWSISTHPLRAPHIATYPIEIPLRCIAAGCPSDGVVLDPFSGAATTGLAARQLGRTYIGIDLNRASHDIGLRRLGLRPQRLRRAP